MKKIAVILAGCGRFDGSEIHEAVITLLSIKQNNYDYQCFSLNLSQFQVYNHFIDEVSKNETRNMVVESARIARGDIKLLEELDVDDYDALVIPGGNGVAYNLFDFFIKGKDYQVNSLVKHKCLEFTNNNKPVCFICAAPIMIPKIYGAGIEYTIGNNNDITKTLSELGAIHYEHSATDIHVDIKHKIVTTPAYFSAKDIIEVYIGIKKAIDEVIKLI